MGPRVMAAFDGRLCRRVVKGKVLKIDGAFAPRVLKFDGPLGRGWWYRPSGDEYEVSVTGDSFSPPS